MMRRLLLLLLALGLWQIGYTRIHCSLEPPDCQEGACELCHLTDIPPLISGSALMSSTPPTPRAAVAPSQCAAVQPPSRHDRCRAPPH